LKEEVDTCGDGAGDGLNPNNTPFHANELDRGVIGEGFKGCVESGGEPFGGFVGLGVLA